MSTGFEYRGGVTCTHYNLALQNLHKQLGNERTHP